MAFWKIVFRLGYMIPRSLPTNYLMLAVRGTWLVVEVPVAFGPGRNEPVLDMWAEGCLYYIH